MHKENCEIVSPPDTSFLEINMSIRRLAVGLPIIALLAACQTGDPVTNSTATGALAGAALGAAVSSSSDRTQGAIIGATVGGLAGNMIGRNNAGQCVYRRADGSTYTAAC
jgi:hypothetical protein